MLGGGFCHRDNEDRRAVRIHDEGRQIRDRIHAESFAAARWQNLRGATKNAACQWQAAHPLWAPPRSPRRRVRSWLVVPISTNSEPAEAKLTRFGVFAVTRIRPKGPSAGFLPNRAAAYSSRPSILKPVPAGGLQYDATPSGSDGILGCAS